MNDSQGKDNRFEIQGQPGSIEAGQVQNPENLEKILARPGISREQKDAAIREYSAKIDSGEISPVPKELDSQSPITTERLQSDRRVDAVMLAKALNEELDLTKIGQPFTITHELLKNAKANAENSKN